MRERDHERDPDEPERRRADETPLQAGPVEAMLALQRSAGNQAVSALVARAPGDTKEADGKTETAKAPGTRATLPGIGTIDLVSVSFPTPQPGVGGRGSSRERTQPAVRDLVVMSRVGKHTPDLHRAVTEGKPMDVEIVIAGARAIHLKLTGAIVSAYQTSSSGQGDAIETWTLNFSAMEYSVEEAEEAKP